MSEYIYTHIISFMLLKQELYTATVKPLFHSVFQGDFLIFAIILNESVFLVKKPSMSFTFHLRLTNCMQVPKLACAISMLALVKIFEEF